jgi:hypothetical protein
MVADLSLPDDAGCHLLKPKISAAKNQFAAVTFQVSTFFDRAMMAYPPAQVVLLSSIVLLLGSTHQ